MKDKTTYMNNSIEYWLALSEKYFDAQTTDVEEKALMHFLASDAANDPAFNEIKAVMGYFTTGKSIAEKRKTNNRDKQHRFDSAIQWASIAACAAAIAVIGTYIGKQDTLATSGSKDLYYACIDGKEYTDEEFVMQHMLTTMNKMSNASSNIVEEKLGAMFRIK